MKGDDNGYRDHTEVHGETEPGEKRPFVRAVVACVGGGVLDQESAEVGTGEEDVVFVLEMSGPRRFELAFC